MRSLFLSIGAALRAAERRGIPPQKCRSGVFGGELLDLFDMLGVEAGGVKAEVKGQKP